MVVAGVCYLGKAWFFVGCPAAHPGLGVLVPVFSGLEVWRWEGKEVVTPCPPKVSREMREGLWVIVQTYDVTGGQEVNTLSMVSNEKVFHVQIPPIHALRRRDFGDALGVNVQHTILWFDDARDVPEGDAFATEILGNARFDFKFESEVLKEAPAPSGFRTDTHAVNGVCGVVQTTEQDLRALISHHAFPVVEGTAMVQHTNGHFLFFLSTSVK